MSFNADDLMNSCLQNNCLQFMAPKKKYRPKDSCNNTEVNLSMTMSTISINSSNLNDTITIHHSDSSPNTNLHSNIIEVHDLSTFANEKGNQQRYKFEYNFNEYLRMFLVKLLPLKEEDMLIKPEEKTLLGPEVKCEKFLKNIRNEMERYSMKIVKYTQDADIEEIEFHLEKKYELRIFKQKYLRLTATQILETYNFFTKPANTFIDRIQAQRIILVRMEKKSETECLQQIAELMKKQAYSPSSTKVHYVHSSSDKSDEVVKTEKKGKSKQPSSSSGEEIVEEEESYYQTNIYMKEKNANSREYSMANFKKMEEPTEDDSISVAGRKREKRGNRQDQKGGEGYRQRGREWDSDEERREIGEKARIVKQYQFQSGEFDQKDFMNWLKSTRDLTDKNVKIISKKDPYNEHYHTYTVQLLAQGNSRSDKELIQGLEVYLKYRRVIMIHLNNEKYRDQLVQKYEKEEDTLTVRYVKGFKSPRWHQVQMWKHVINKSYTEVKKSANTQYFQLFFLEGLKNLVSDIEKEIRSQLEAEPTDDLNQQLFIKLPQLSDHIRNHHKLKDLLKQYLEKMISSNYKHCCEIASVDFPLCNIKLILRVKIEQQQQYHRTVKDQIVEKFLKEVKIREFVAAFKIDKHTYEKLDKIVIIIKKEEKKFYYVSTIFNIEDILNKINNIINSQNSLGEKDLEVDDKILVKKINQFLGMLTSGDSEFADVKHNYSSDQRKFKFYGRDYLLDNLIDMIQQYMTEIQEKRINYFQIAKIKEGKLLEKDKILADIAAKYDIVVHVKEVELPCKIIISPPLFKKKTILIVKSKGLDYAPCGSVIAFRSLQQVDLFKNNYFMKIFRSYINKHKTDIFNENTRRHTILFKQNQSLIDTLNSALAVNPNPANHVIMIMPETGKEAFVKTIVKELLENKNLETREVTVMIIEYDQSVDLLKQLNMTPYVKGKKLQLKDQKLTKYYVQDNKNKFYYSESGNRKILTAKQKGLSKIILNNEDLNITHNSHSFVTQNRSIVHLQSHKEIPVKLSNNKVQFQLKNQIYEIPQLQSVKIINAINAKVPNIDLSLGVYEIDLSAMKQINLFSDYQRKLCIDEVLIKAEMNQEEVQTFYNVKAVQIEYLYYFDDNIMDNFYLSRESVNDFLKDHLKEKEISYKDFKNIEASDLEMIKNAIEEDQQTQFTYNFGAKTLMLKALDETALSRCEHMIDTLLKNLNQRNQINPNYPAEWQPQQEDIRIVEVIENSKQFADVQANFAIHKIKKLYRIQNKIIYKKYYDESVFLQSLNGGKKVKRMRLFHGTRSTNPQEIYKDKEESFNINYSSDNNLLGKGIYFAEKAAYSDGYKYTEVVSTKGFFGTKTQNEYSMFLCEVLVGESEKCKQHNGAIKDTGYRDPVNKIKYQSMTDYLNNSNIFVVYKSRRAYPLYLIKY